MREIALILVLVQGQPRAGLVAVDEAGIGSEIGIARSLGGRRRRDR